MCVVSMVMDHFNDKWDKPQYDPLRQYINNVRGFNQVELDRLKVDFENLKKEVEEMKALLKRAKLYDEANNEPNCELETKMTMLRKIAEIVGVDLDEILKPKE